MMKDKILSALGIEDVNPGGFAGDWLGSGPDLEVYSPIDGSHLATVQQVTEPEYDAIVDRAHAAFLEWRKVPAPRRGEIVRQLGNKLRENKQATGAGADRVSQGMRLAFGKNVGTAARCRKNDVIVSIHTSAEFYLDARNALRKAGMKFPSSVTISVSRGAEHLRVKGLI